MIFLFYGHGKDTFERECIIGIAVLTKVIQPFLAFFYTWQLSGRDPPQGIIRTIEFLEPTLTVAQNSIMSVFVDKFTQGLKAFPDGQVDNDHVIIIDLHAGRIAAIGLKPPDKAGTIVGKRVDRSQ